MEKIKCNCGRLVNEKEIVFRHKLDLNTFDWWRYQHIEYDDKKEKLKTSKIVVRLKPWGYIGYVPLLSEIPYYCHKWFHKPDYFEVIECRLCETPDSND